MAEFTLDAKSVRAKLVAAMSRAPKECARALYAEALIEAKESMKRTPVLTGALRASTEVTLLETRDNSAATIKVGGPSAEYAVFVHENLDADHKVGQAKFLESTIQESRPYMAARIAARIDLKEIF